jgi:predicted nucleotidyltransferase
MLLQDLTKKELINPPSWLASNTQYLTLMGSRAYGCATDKSDFDIYGVCIPPKDMIFPNLNGIIFVPQSNGMWKPISGQVMESFPQWETKKAVIDPSTKKEYDIHVFNIVRYFDLLIDNNPNIIDSLFTAIDCVMHLTTVGSLIRENRSLFLHKGCWNRFKQYAISQLHKMKTKEPIGKRKEMRDAHGFDVKFAYNIVRLLEECQDILLYQDIDLRRNNEQLKAIRRGEVNEDDIIKWANDKVIQLEGMFANTKLPDKPPIEEIIALLHHCLEEHYGSLKGLVDDGNNWAKILLRNIDKLVTESHSKIYN